MAIRVYEEPNIMDPKQKLFIKAFSVAYFVRGSDLTKAYMASTVAAFYGIRAALRANEVLDDLIAKEERLL